MAKKPPSIIQIALELDIADNEKRIAINEYLLTTMHNARRELLERRAGLLAIRTLAPTSPKPTRPFHSRNCPHSPAFRPNHTPLQPPPPRPAA